MNRRRSPADGVASPRVSRFVHDVAGRLLDADHVDDLNSWWGGSLEHWVQIEATAVARNNGWWAASTEIPFKTYAPSPGRKDDTKWADGAFIREDSLVLLEVKTIPHRAGRPLGRAMRSVAVDLGALLGIDWSRTLAYEDHRGYVDASWRDARTGVRRAYGVALAFVHGDRPLRESIQGEIRAALALGTAGVGRRTRQTVPSLATDLTAALERPILQRRRTARRTEVVAMAWVAVLPVRTARTPLISSSQ